MARAFTGGSSLPAKILRFARWRGVALGLCCALLSWWVAHVPLVRGLDDWLFDGCFYARGARSRPLDAQRIILVGLDDRSLDEIGKPLVCISPELATIVRYVRAHGAAAIGIDSIIPFNLRDFPELQAGAEGDATLLGAAVQDAGNVVLAEWKLPDGWLRPIPQWNINSFLPELARPTDLGFVNISPDDDQFLRRQQLAVLAPHEGTQTIEHYHFALALVEVAQHLGCSCRDGRLFLADHEIPLDRDGLMRINFVGPPHTFPEVPFGVVLKAAQDNLANDSTNWQGAIVIMGMTNRSQQDVHATPYANNYAKPLAQDASGLMSGPEVHANIVATLADRAFIRTLPMALALATVLAVGVLLAVALHRLNLERGLLLTVAHHFAWKFAALAVFIWFNIRLEMMGMLLTGGLVYAATFALRWRRLRRMFGLVKSEAVAQALEEEPDRLAQLGEEREITVLFADVRDFTTFSEQHAPSEVVALLNAYFTALVPCIVDQLGTIDRYIGDGIMVIFGAPKRNRDHAVQGVRSAVAMVRQVHRLRQQWSELGCPDFRIGVGVHTGKAVVGAVGSPRRLDYTAHGDTVNVAARVEAENKVRATEILITSDTFAALTPAERTELGCDDVGQMAQVKGRQQTLLLHAVRVE
jgi:adenylate cyclase